MANGYHPQGAMYVSFYRLNDRPFQLNPDQRFFVETPRQGEILGRLAHGIEEGTGFVVLTGRAGTGKTTIAERFLSRLDRGAFLHAWILTSRIGADDLPRLVASALRLPFEGIGKAVLLRSIEAFLVECHKQKKRLLLAVDEAHNLPPDALEELRMLTNFQAAHRPLLQCLIIGQPALAGILARDDMEQCRQRVVAACTLEPFDREEVRTYVEHRLRRAGWHGDPRFADDTFDLIHRYSGGIPRRINLLCGRLLLFGYLEELHEIDGAVVTRIVQELEDEMRFEAPPWRPDSPAVRPRNGADRRKDATQAPWHAEADPAHV